MTKHHRSLSFLRSRIQQEARCRETSTFCSAKRSSSDSAHKGWWYVVSPPCLAFCISSFSSSFALFLLSISTLLLLFSGTSVISFVHSVAVNGSSHSLTVDWLGTSGTNSSLRSLTLNRAPGTVSAWKLEDISSASRFSSSTFLFFRCLRMLLKRPRRPLRCRGRDWDFPWSSCDFWGSLDVQNSKSPEAASLQPLPESSQHALLTPSYVWLFVTLVFDDPFLWLLPRPLKKLGRTQRLFRPPKNLKAVFRIFTEGGDWGWGLSWETESDGGPPTAPTTSLPVAVSILIQMTVANGACL